LLGPAAGALKQVGHVGKREHSRQGERDAGVAELHRDPRPGEHQQDVQTNAWNVLGEFSEPELLQLREEHTERHGDDREADRHRDDRRNPDRRIELERVRRRPGDCVDHERRRGSRDNAARQIAEQHRAQACVEADRGGELRDNRGSHCRPRSEERAREDINDE
jgi:hypothetical protein